MPPPPPPAVAPPAGGPPEPMTGRDVTSAAPAVLEVSGTVIGRGGEATVRTGTLNGRPVAVKDVLLSRRAAGREAAVLRALPPHATVRLSPETSVFCTRRISCVGRDPGRLWRCVCMQRAVLGVCVAVGGRAVP